MRKKSTHFTMQAWKEWCQSRMNLRAICVRAVLKLQHNTLNAALAAWKGFLVLCDAQRQKLRACIASMRSCELRTALRSWQSSAVVLRELRLILIPVIAKWRVRHGPFLSQCRQASETLKNLRSSDGIPHQLQMQLHCEY